MLTAPDAHNRPLFAADEITQFYLDHCSIIFPQPNPVVLCICSGFFEHAKKWIHDMVGGPKYDGKYLHALVRELLGETRLHQTLTSVVIPDPLLSDVCISTSAAPTYFPPHRFHVNVSVDGKEEIREFNLIDGGVAANNPTTLPYGSLPDICKGNPDFFTMGKGKVLILSLGTGTSTIVEAEKQKLTADVAANWGTLGWVRNTNAFTDILSPAESDMALNDNAAILGLNDDGALSSMDIATKENLDNLVRVGEELLKKPVTQVSVNTGALEPVIHDNLGREETNEEALVRFAKLLSNERKDRLERKDGGDVSEDTESAMAASLASSSL
ncbi:hypothetical protein MKW94_029925 [Papaver nudicaule]|uniref:Patatin n=1 Tax=Papaver nudicaule TaxID=74823 RepID=A0AA41RQ03_PAPNU|nr:hypothetical protein [Papaver nudicaule]